MNSGFDTFFILLDKMIEVLDYIETQFKKEDKYTEIEMKNRKKYVCNNYIENGYTLVTNYSKMCKKDYM
jgi:hypothetical protein